jgi:hypothetical protein
MGAYGSHCKEQPIISVEIRSQVKLYEIYGGQSDTGENFLRVLQFAPSVRISLIAAPSLIILSLTLHSLDTEGVVRKETKNTAVVFC